MIAETREQRHIREDLDHGTTVYALCIKCGFLHCAEYEGCEPLFRLSGYLGTLTGCWVDQKYTWHM